METNNEPPKTILNQPFYAQPYCNSTVYQFGPVPFEREELSFALGIMPSLVSPQRGNVLYLKVFIHLPKLLLVRTELWLQAFNYCILFKPNLKTESLIPL